MTHTDPVLEDAQESPGYPSFPQLMAECAGILRQFSPYALAAAIASAAIMIAALGIHPAIAVVLSVAVYAGSALMIARPSLSDLLVEEPRTDDEQAFDQARVCTRHVLALAEEVEKPDIRDHVRAIGNTFTKMLDTMEEDGKYAAAPEYQARLVCPFELLLGNYLRLTKRGIPSQSANFEEFILPTTETFAKSVFQHYHDDAVINQAAWSEIFRIYTETNEDESSDDLDEFEMDLSDDDEFGRTAS